MKQIPSTIHFSTIFISLQALFLIFYAIFSIFLLFLSFLCPIDKREAKQYNKNNVFIRGLLMQRIGIIFDTCQEIDDRARIALMQKHGFEATFLMSNDPQMEERVSRLREAGITVANCHAPFDGINNWNGILNALEEFGFDGVFNYEVAANGPEGVRAIRENYEKLMQI